MRIEFFKKLNDKVITTDYDISYFKEISTMIKDEYQADTVTFVNTHSNRVNDNMFCDVSHILENDLVLDINDNIKLVIRNNKKNIDKDILVPILSNIFKIYNLVEKLKEEKHTDGLLKVKNRHAYEELISKNMCFTNVGIAFVDANGLGIINNMYNYEKGDELLKTICKALTTYFRTCDVYRIGGDEFVVICQDIEEEMFFDKINKSKERLNSTEYNASYGAIYCKFTSDLKKNVETASNLMKKNKEQYRKEHPEKYIDKYKIKHND